MRSFTLSVYLLVSNIPNNTRHEVKNLSVNMESKMFLEFMKKGEEANFSYMMNSGEPHG